LQKKIVNNCILFIIGTVSFAVQEILWVWIFGNSFGSQWILESTPGIVLCFIIIVLMGLISGYQLISSFIEAISYLFGIFFSISIMLFIIGSGNLWPIVLIIDYIIVTPAALLGCLLGFWLAKKYK